jgi:hypothetical protein
VALLEPCLPAPNLLARIFACPLFYNHMELQVRKFDKRFICILRMPVDNERLGYFEDVLVTGTQNFGETDSLNRSIEKFVLGENNGEAQGNQ